MARELLLAQRLTGGELPLDDGFTEGVRNDLRRAAALRQRVIKLIAAHGQYIVYKNSCGARIRDDWHRDRARNRARNPDSTDSGELRGFLAAWSGWTLDGMDSFIYALVLRPRSPSCCRSPAAPRPGARGVRRLCVFALFLVGWGLAFLWGPVADRFGRTRTLAASVLVYALFTGAAAFAQNVWELALFRFLAGIGVGGEWAMAGTYVAEAWPEDRRKMGAGYLQTGYYFGFFLAAALNYTVGAQFGWRAMFLCGFAPVVVSFCTLLKVKEPERWEQAEAEAKRTHPLARDLRAAYRGAPSSTRRC